MLWIKVEQLQHGVIASKRGKLRKSRNSSFLKKKQEGREITEAFVQKKGSVAKECIATMATENGSFVQPTIPWFDGYYDH